VSRSASAGGGLLAGLALVSFVVSRLSPEVVAAACPLGQDLLRPERSVCALALGGLWVSLAIGVCAGALATVAGLGVAACARLLGGAPEALLMRGVEAVFSLPDVLMVMVLQLAAEAFAEAHPRWGVGGFSRMVLSLALVTWAGPARMFRDRLETLGRQEFVSAARALGGSSVHVMRLHLWPGLRGFVLAVFLSRLPAAVLAESTVSFLGVASMEPMSLGRYLGTSYSALIYEGGSRIVLPAWGLLVLLVLGASLAARPASVRTR